MREFHCPSCRAPVSFEHIECATCGQNLLFDPSDLKTMSRLSLEHACENRGIIGCNWSTEDKERYCSSCSLTRTIPNLSVARNVPLWRRAEEAKRRLIYDLARLHLPLTSPGGAIVAFDILSDDEQAVLTGHLSGLITLNLREADDVEREARRVSFREPYRTLLGHFRHEIGHFYWDLLVKATKLEAPFRLIFGDETRDYQSALAAYYSRADRSYDRKHFISEYATSHPWEDWAETFAHFLHIVSTLDSMAGLPLSLESRAQQTLKDPYLESDFEALLALWEPLARSINELNRSLGLGDAYPFALSQAVKGKLHLVHMAISHIRDKFGCRQEPTDMAIT
jgi:hypothetical protein